MLILGCTRCGKQHAPIDTVSELVDYRSGELTLPDGWFEHEGKLYCGGHERRPRNCYEIVDVEPFAPFDPAAPGAQTAAYAARFENHPPRPQPTFGDGTSVFKGLPNGDAVRRVPRTPPPDELEQDVARPRGDDLGGQIF
jgi:hypothetical protein